MGDRARENSQDDGRMRLPSLLTASEAAPQLRFVPGKPRRKTHGRAAQVWRLPRLEVEEEHDHQSPEVEKQLTQWIKSVSNKEPTSRVSAPRCRSSAAPQPSKSLATPLPAFQDSVPSVPSLPEVQDDQNEPEIQDVAPNDHQVDLSPAFESMLARYQEVDEDAKEHARESAKESSRMHVVFKRFCLEGTTDVPKGRLHDVLHNLGMCESSPNQVEDMAASLSRFPNMDWVDFSDFVFKSSQNHTVAVRRAAEKCVSELKGKPTMSYAQKFLRSIGIFAEDQAVSNALKVANADIGSLNSLGDLLSLAAAYRVNEGFTTSEVAEAKKIFDNLEKHPKDSTLIKVSALSMGLLELQGLYCVDHLTALMQGSFPSASESMPGVSLYEFLVWARRLRTMELQELWECFATAGGASAGSVRVEGARAIALRLGFTIAEDFLSEILGRHPETRGDVLDFNAIICFVRELQKTHGFPEAELEQYQAVFHKFDATDAFDGELTSLQVLEVLRYLGYKMDADQVHVFIKKVDFNQNGTMDMEEYLRLMRLMRETYIFQAQWAFDKVKKSNTGLPKECIPKALSKLSEFPQQEVLEELLRDVAHSVTFDQFLRLVDHCRATSTVVSRKRAGFCDHIYYKLLRIFKGDDPSRQELAFGELMWMLSDSPVEVNTKDGRSGLLKQIDSARTAAADAGVPESELGQAGASVGFFTLLHLVREITREFDQKAATREQQTIKAINFDSSEVDEYRRLFLRLRSENDGGKDGLENYNSETLGGLIRTVISAQRIPETSLLGMLKGLGLRMSFKQLGDFTVKLREMNAGSEGWIDFVCFLRMLHWMLDSNHANINCTAKKILANTNH